MCTGGFDWRSGAQAEVGTANSCSDTRPPYTELTVLMNTVITVCRNVSISLINYKLEIHYLQRWYGFEQDLTRSGLESSNPLSLSSSQSVSPSRLGPIQRQFKLFTSPDLGTTTLVYGTSGLTCLFMIPKTGLCYGSLYIYIYFFPLRSMAG